MAQLRLKSGDVFRISLPNELGFAFGKYINLLEINATSQYPALMRIYNFRSADPGEIIPDSKRNELLFSPLLVAAASEAIKKGSWKFVENTSLTVGEQTIPHYKASEPFLLLDEENAKEWYYVAGADVANEKFKSNYANVKHLETFGATGSSLVSTKIAMGLLKEEGKEIKDYFTLQDYFEKVYYSDVTRIPAYFRQPPEMQGRARNN